MPELYFYVDRFCMKWPTKVYMPSEKETKSNQYFSVFAYLSGKLQILFCFQNQVPDISDFRIVWLYSIK